MKPKLTLEKLDKVAEITATLLEEHFGDELAFGPIMVIPKIDDHYADDVFPYVHIYIVFDGDQSKLDPSRTRKISGQLMPLLEEIGVYDWPITSWVSKSDWKRTERRMQRELERELEDRAIA